MLTGTGHENQSYEINSATAYLFADIAKLLSDLSGKPIQYVSPTAEEFGTALVAAGPPRPFRYRLVSAWPSGRASLIFLTLEKLLGRQPKSAADFLKAAYQL